MPYWHQAFLILRQSGIKMILVHNLKNVIRKFETNVELNNRRKQIMLPMLRISRPAFLANDFFRTNFFGDLLDNESNLSKPAVNIAEEADKFVIELAAPGFGKNDFKINVKNQVLTISSTREAKKEDKEYNYTRKEFSYSSFSRSFGLPESIDSDSISATYADGILYVSVPKKEEAKVKPAREIAIA